MMDIAHSLIRNQHQGKLLPQMQVYVPKRFYLTLPILLYIRPHTVHAGKPQCFAQITRALQQPTQFYMTPLFTVQGRPGHPDEICITLHQWIPLSYLSSIRRACQVFMRSPEKRGGDKIYNAWILTAKLDLSAQSKKQTSGLHGGPTQDSSLTTNLRTFLK